MYWERVAPSAGAGAAKGPCCAALVRGVYWGLPAMPALTLPLCVPHAFADSARAAGDASVSRSRTTKKRPPPPPPHGSSSKLKWAVFIVASLIIAGAAYRKFAR